MWAALDDATATTRISGNRRRGEGCLPDAHGCREGRASDPSSWVFEGARSRSVATEGSPDRICIDESSSTGFEGTARASGSYSVACRRSVVSNQRWLKPLSLHSD